MRYYLQTIIVFILLSSNVLEAQVDVSIRKKDFNVGKSGFEEAWKHVSNGDSFYKKKGINYSRAFDEYSLALVYNNSNPELNYKTGVSALFSSRKEEAEAFFLKALEGKVILADDILLLTGRALQYSGKYPEALEKFDSYLNAVIKKNDEKISLARKYIDECNSAIILTKDTLGISIDNSGSAVNSNADDYAELFSSDGKIMFFASRREYGKSSDYYPDSKFDENIFVSRQNGGKWELASSAGNNLNTKYCEAPLYLDSTNTKLYIYAGYKGGGDVLVSQSRKGEWKTPEQASFGINSGGYETSFTFSPSGREIYFVTDSRKDNLGGKDIYIIKKISDRKWSKPVNAGSLINTAYDEESVRFSKSGDTLWFSSKGHNSIGGFDIFFSSRNQAGEWTSPMNYGYPVNTPWDEIFYYPCPDDDSAFYFVSNRPGGLGGLDIYKGHILPPVPVAVIVPPTPVKPDTVIIRDTVIVREIIPPPVVPVVLPEPVKETGLSITGTVKDSETGDPVMAKIDIIDIGTEQVVLTTASSDIDGSYTVKLPSKKSYKIDLRATGFLSDLKRIDIPEAYSQEVFNLDLTLTKLKVGKKVVMNNILFETGKYVLTQGSYAELNRLLGFMQDNEKMKIEISGHTDKTGSEPINFRLSEGRAKAVVDYLVQKGIDRARIEYRGFGSLQPIADNSTPQGRAQNRRVEFKILEF